MIRSLKLLRTLAPTLVLKSSFCSTQNGQIGGQKDSKAEKKLDQGPCLTQIPDGNSQQKQKSEKRDTALAAAKIIKFIVSQPSLVEASKAQPQILKQMKQNSLSTLAIKELEDSKINRSVIKTFSQMFNPNVGVVLPRYLQSQGRIKRGSNQRLRFSFFPNRLVTVDVFKNLMEFQMKTLMYGPPGISKTSSIVLYCYLCYLINQYQFDYDEVVAAEIPRIFYLSYRKIKDTPDVIESMLDKQISRLLSEQCSSKMASKLKGKTSGAVQLEIIQAFLQKDLKIKGVVDQFNSFVSQIRKFNQDQQSGSLSQEEINIRKNILKLEQSYWINKLNSLSSQAILYNSSRNIEEYLIKTPKDSSDLFIDLNHHQKLRHVDLDFFSALNLNLGKRQIVRTLFFELQRHCQNADQVGKLSQIQRAYMKQSDQQIQNLPELDLTHYQIRQYLDEAKKKKLLNLKDLDKQTPEKMKFVSDLVQAMVGEYLVTIRRQLLHFCREGSFPLQMRKVNFLFKLRNLLLKQVKDSTKKEQALAEIPTYTIKYLEQNGVKVERMLINKNIFSVDQNDENPLYILASRFSREGLLFITEFAIQFLDSLSTEQFRRSLNLVNLSKSILGILLEKKFLHLLSKIKNKQFNISNFFVINGSQQFLHFNAQKKTMSLAKRFEKMINLSLPIVAGLPVQKTPNQQSRKMKKKGLLNEISNSSQTSKTIDFLILQKIDRNKYKVHSFDFTLSQIASNLKKKVEAARNLIANQVFAVPKNNEGLTNFCISEWNHTILGVNIARNEEYFTVQAKCFKQDTTVKCSIKTSQIQDLHTKIDQKEQKWSSQQLQALKAFYLTMNAAYGRSIL